MFINLSQKLETFGTTENNRGKSVKIPVKKNCFLVQVIFQKKVIRWKLTEIEIDYCGNCTALAAFRTKTGK